MSKYHWLLDAGHGGMKDGVYTTAPAKMYRFEDGLFIYEGLINRQITKKVYGQLQLEGIDFTLVYDEVHDDFLTTRVNRANKVYKKDKRAILLSIHSNSAKGSGFEIFTSPGQTKSDKVAAIFCDVYKQSFPDFPFRSCLADGDLDKEAKFTVLTDTRCPALLVENLFFDNRKEAEFLLSDHGQLRIATCIVNGIKEVERLKPI